MAEDIQQKAYDSQVARLMQDFMQLQVKFWRVGLPEELARVQDRLDDMYPRDRAKLAATYDLFYRTSHHLYRKSSLTMGELSRALSAPLSTATGMVDWLVDNGYAQRLPDPEDRRIVRVALTDDGRKLHETIESYLGRRVQQMFSCLTDDERDTLFAIIRKVVSAMRKVEV